MRRRRATRATARNRRLAVLATVATGLGLVAASGALALPSAGSDTVGRQPDGSVRTATGQILTPTGRQVEFRGRPNAMAVRPDGQTAAVLVASAPNGESVRVLDLATGAVEQSVTGHGASVDGIAYSPDGTLLFTSDGGASVGITPVHADGTLGARTAVTFPGDPFTTGIGVSPDGATLYVGLSKQNALGIVNVATRTILGTVGVGVAPHSVVVDAGTVYVSDEGGRLPVAGDTTNTSAGGPVVSDPFGGGTTTGAVSVVDAASRHVIATVPVGLHPTAMTADGGYLFVAGTNDDTVSVVSTASRSVVNTLTITPFPRAPYGSQPTGLRIVGDRLFVSLGNDNAIAVYRLSTPTEQPALLGLLPTAAYPSAVGVSTQRGELVVPNLRGVGSTADADNGSPARSVSGEVGSVSLLPLPTDAQVVAGGLTVAHNNGWDRLSTECARPGVAAKPVPDRAGEPSTIDHVVYIIKENRTYDQVLGDLPQGNGLPALTQFGATVTPNQHALATTFGLFDNFYDSGRRSNDGHNWAVQATSPDYLEKDPATRRVTGSAPSQGTPPSSGFDALLYTPAGFLWENVLRAGKSFQDFGEYTREDNTPPADTDIPSLRPHIVPDYPGYNLNFLDVDRAAIFKRELATHETAGTFPALTLMTLSNDHTGGGAPPYDNPASQVSDNDRATGEIVDAVSHSSFWPHTAVFVIEDDSQSGLDHIDGHRSTLYVASPYARRGIVDSTPYDQIDVVRTIELMLGLPPLNQLTLAASPLRSAFTHTVDLTPFDALPAIVPFRTPNPPLAQQTGLRRAWSGAVARQDLRHLDAADEQLLNRDIWYETKGFDVPYPGDGRVLRPDEVPPSARGQGGQGAQGGPGARGGRAVSAPAVEPGEGGPAASEADVAAAAAAAPRAVAFACGPAPAVPELRLPALLAGVALLVLAGGGAVRGRRSRRLSRA